MNANNLQRARTSKNYNSHKTVNRQGIRLYCSSDNLSHWAHVPTFCWALLTVCVTPVAEISAAWVFALLIRPFHVLPTNGLQYSASTCCCPRLQYEYRRRRTLISDLGVNALISVWRITRRSTYIEATSGKTRKMYLLVYDTLRHKNMCGVTWANELQLIYREYVVAEYIPPPCST